MSAMKFFLVAVITTFVVFQVSADDSAKDRLFHALLQNYHPELDPGNIDVNVSISFICSYVDKQTDLVITNAWEQCMWKDSRLSWNPSHFDDIQSMRIPANLVWTPDFRLYNTMTSLVERDSDVNVVVSHDGSVIYVPRSMYRTFCSSEVPDGLNCDMRFGSWTYDGNNVKLGVVEGGDGVVLEYYSSSCPLKVESHSAKVVVHKYDCCEEPYPSLDMTIVFKPRY